MTNHQWCNFTTTDGHPCSFGAAHNVEYHYCNGRRYRRFTGTELTPEDFNRITNGGTR